MRSSSNTRSPIPPLESEKDNHIGRRTVWLLLAGVFLVSFSLLAYEISLTRVLSVMLFYHYVFIVISVALLGLGAGGVYVYLFRRGIPRGQSQFSSLAMFVSLFSLSIPLSVMAMTRLGADNILLYTVFLFIPFFFAGIFLSEVFRMFPALSSKIYGVDLLGAAAAAVGVVLALNYLGDINTVFVLGLLASIAALLYASRTASRSIRGKVLPAISFLAVSTLLVTNLIGPGPFEIPVGKNETKEIYSALKTPGNKGEIIKTKWSAFGRTDLVGISNDPEEMGLYIDGTSGTSMYQFNGDINNPGPLINNMKVNFPGYLPFSVLSEAERDSALIIGPGGGRDILLALMGGVRNITAVEVNKELVDIMREYSWYNGGIYSGRENVSVYVDEGRNFLKRQTEKYDIIMLSLPITKTSRSPEGYALTENFLFTTDSINDYLNHLTDEGRLIVVAHDPIEIMKLLSVSLASLNQRGVANEAALKQISFIGSHHFPVFVLKKTPFESAEMVSIHKSIHQLGYEPTLSYLPTIKSSSDVYHVEDTRFGECSMLFQPGTALSSGEIYFNEIEQVLQENKIDISPATDNSPFFYKFEAGIPSSVSIVLWASLAMLLLVILLPAVYRAKRASLPDTKSANNKGLSLFKFAALFTMLGAGFMLVEISTIQRFILFLGQPVLSLAVLLFSLLIGAGLGSIFSARFAPERLTRVISIAAASVVFMLVVYAFSLSFVFERLLGLDLAIRLLATVVLLTPLGFLMGFLFPSGMRLLKAAAMEAYIPWMWGINGISSVLGSAATIVIAINFGFTEALLAGAAAYFIVFLIFLRTNLSNKPVRKGGVPVVKFSDAITDNSFQN